MIYGSDWGSYLSAIKGPALPFKDLYDGGLLDFFVTKGCQEAEYYSSVKNIQWAREAGCKCVGSYYWHHPSGLPAYWIEVYSAAIRLEKPDFIALDMEDAQGLSDWEITTNAEKVCEGLSQNFPDLKLYIYTSADYINGHCPTFNRSINKYGRWIACWPGVIHTGMDRYLSFDEIKQYPLPDWKVKLPTGWSSYDVWQSNNWAIPEGYGWPYDHQYDWNASPLTIEQIMGKEPQTMTTLYKTDKPQIIRAKVFEYRADQKYLYDVKDMGIDAVILPMAGMDLWQDGHKKLYSVASFKGRFSQFTTANIPVIGRVSLDGGYWLKEGHTDVEVKSQTALPEMTEPQKVIAIRNNLVLSKVFDAWADGAWTWDMVFAKQVKWLDIKAIELGMVETEGFGTSTISDLWQTLTFNHVATCLNYLKLRSYIPNIPVVLYTGPWFLGPLTKDFAIMLANAKTWLYLHLGQWTLTSTATFNNLGEIFAFRPAETFKFSSIPDGYTERILFHEYTGNTQSVVDLGKVSLSLYQSDKPDLSSFLGAVTPPVVPPVDPPVEPTDLTPVLDALNALTIKVDDAAVIAEANRRILMQEILSLRARIDSIYK